MLGQIYRSLILGFQRLFIQVLNHYLSILLILILILCGWALKRTQACLLPVKIFLVFQGLNFEIFLTLKKLVLDLFQIWILKLLFLHVSFRHQITLLILLLKIPSLQVLAHRCSYVSALKINLKKLFLFFIFNILWQNRCQRFLTDFEKWNVTDGAFYLDWRLKVLRVF